MEDIEKTPIFDQCYSTIKDWLSKDEELNIDNIFEFTLKVINLVQKISDGSGSYKKMLVINLIKKLVREIDYKDQETRTTVLNLIDKLLPAFIDVSIKVAKGEIDIGKKFGLLRNFCRKYFCCKN